MRAYLGEIVGDSHNASANAIKFGPYRRSYRRGHSRAQRSRHVGPNECSKLAQSDPKNIILDIADMARAGVPMSSAFIAEMARKTPKPRSGRGACPHLDRTALDGTRPNHRAACQHRQPRQATNHIAIGNSITSLRFLTSIDWKDFVESLSRVENILREDPAGIYPKMDFATRDRYRHPIESMARKSAASEESVALKAVARAQSAHKGDKCAHIGTYLIESGRPELERDLGIRLTIGIAAARLGRKMPLALYVGPMLASAGLATLFLRDITLAGMTASWVMGTLLFLGFSQAAVSLVNWVVTMTVKPRVLPKMDFSEGIPHESGTLVTVPSMLAGKRAVAGLLDKMEICYLSNRADNLYFSLLTDFEDAPSQTMPGDAELLDLAKTGIRRLNDLYGRNGLGPFLYFHRPRAWNPRELCWMGYERKRGKLETLNGFLRTLKPDGFLIEGNVEIARYVKYVITLDTNTDLPRDCAKHLIEAMAIRSIGPSTIASNTASPKVTAFCSRGSF